MRKSTRRALLICAAALPVLIGGPAVPHAEELDDAFRRALSELLDREADADVAAVYRGSSDQPLWYGRPDRQAIVAAALARASGHGIRDGAIAAALSAPEPWPRDPSAAAERELGMTRAVLRDAEAQAGLRLDPRRLYPDWGLEPPRRDLAGDLETALGSGTLAAWLDQLPSRRAEYLALLAAFARYEALAHGAAWPRLPERALLKRGGVDPGFVPLLRERLAAEGYPAEPGGDVLDERLSHVIAEFQRRHGLVEDGSVGPRTLAALNVPVAERAETIRLNLERWRWMPREVPARLVLVNAASASLTVREEERVLLSMRVIVGDRRHPTPVFESRVETVVLNPPWDVPRSITRREILPRLSRDPGYLDRNDMIVRERDGRGVPRLRQLPGPQNALGRIKLEIPSGFDVYLHDTPDRKLFARADRALSHGCIRLENPLALAAYVLRGQGEWDAARLTAAIGEAKTRRIMVRAPLAVEIGYWTAFADDAGPVQFRDDIYGRDEVLREALAAVEPEEPRAPARSAAAASGEPVGCGRG